MQANAQQSLQYAPKTNAGSIIPAHCNRRMPDNLCKAQKKDGKPSFFC
jgi:hypothetical protein